MKTYLVGGAVRDRLLGIPVYDRDWVVVGASVEQMAALGYHAVGRDFPVFLHPKSKEEYALARTERKSGHGYKGFEFYASPEVSLEQDLLRRDLTVNAMAEDDDGEIIDPFGGQQDLQKHCLRHVSEAFSEDPLRVLRVARFSAKLSQLGFTVAPETQQLMSEIAASGELEHLTRERVWAELERSLTEPSPQQFFQVLKHCNGLQILIPEVDQLLSGPESDAAITALQRCANLKASAAATFATLCRFISSDRAIIEPMLERLKAPRQFKELCLLICQHADALLHLEQRTAEQKLRLYEGLDLQRRAERLPQILTSCRALAGLDRDHHPFALEQQLQQICEAINSVQPATLAAEGLKGKALGTELRHRRIQALHQLEQA